jgi:recombination protein RecR
MQTCSECCAPSIDGLCTICGDPARDRSVICVTEDLLDVLALERGGHYRGVYHVLQGAINPIDGIGPDQLRIRELLTRLQRPDVHGVILAMKPNTNGVATANYLARAIGPLGVSITRGRF